MRRGRWVGQRRCTSGAKALLLESSFFAALKALRHPKAVRPERLRRPKAAPSKTDYQRNNISKKQTGKHFPFDEAVEIDSKLHRSFGARNAPQDDSYDAGILAAP